MKRLVPFFSLAASGALCAATAFPSAASNYAFVTPHFPAHIRGLVMGSPPAYYIPRNEDFDWLAEAIAERMAYAAGSFASTNTVLHPEFGKWALSETNHFSRWVTAVDAAGVTNVVVGYHLVTNAPSSRPATDAVIGTSYYLAGSAAGEFWNPPGTVDWRNGYLDPAAELVTDAKVYRGATYTNIYSLAGYTNGWTNATSTISMPMTNGTVSVHTNIWTAYRQYPVAHTYTNVFESRAFDACHTGDGPFPGYTNVPPFFAGSMPAAFSNDYAALRGAVRLADYIVAATNAPARVDDVALYRGVAYTNDLYESYAAISPWHWTNTTSSVSTNNYSDDWIAYDLDTYHSTWEETVLYKDANGEVKTATVPGYTVSVEEEGRTSGTAVFETRFDSGLASVGGEATVSVEAVYAQVSFYYSDHSLTNYDDRTVIHTNVVVRLAGPVLAASGPRAVVEVAIDSRAICAIAASAAGAPAPPDIAAADPGAGRGTYWSVSVGSALIFYRTRPASKLGGW